MARIYSRRKGSSGSTKPFRTGPPIWVNYSPDEVVQIVVKLANEGMTPAEIGLALRDSYGIPSVKLITDKSITKILKEEGIESEIPSDLFSLLEKAVKMRKHLNNNVKDLHVKRGLQNTERKIIRLVNYYKDKGVLKKSWKYSPAKARVIVSGGK